MNARMFRGPADSFKTSTTSIISSLMFLAARPDRIAKSQHWDLIVPNCTSNDLRRGAFGKNAAKGSSQRVLPRGKKDRITGSYGRNLSSREGGRPLPPDTFNPHCFHVPWHVLSILMRGHPLNLQCHPRIPFAHGHITISFPCICGAR